MDKTDEPRPDKIRLTKCICSCNRCQAGRFQLKCQFADVGRCYYRSVKRILVVLCLTIAQAYAQKVTINYPARTGSNWPLWMAKEGGYYQKYGLDVDLVFGV